MQSSTVYSHTQAPRREFSRNITQGISLIVGGALFVLALCGMLFPAFMGLHLSLMQSSIILLAGVTLFYAGYKVNRRVAFRTCLGFGLFFGALSATGFVFGQPGRPSVGFERLDPYLIRIIPGFQELGFVDHSVHAVLAVVLLAGAFDWYRKHPHRH